MSFTVAERSLLEPRRPGLRGGHVLQVFEPARAGVPRYVASLSEGLIERGWSVSVVAPPENTEMDRLLASGARVIPTSGSFGSARETCRWR